ncbi:MAG: hypothetical protein ACLQPD_26110 [Desulfomonilaceae bacterium]
MRRFLIIFILALLININSLPMISASETTISNNQQALAGQTIRNRSCFASDCFFPANLWAERISSNVGTQYLLAADNDNNEDTGEDASKKDSGPEPPDRIANSVCYG